ncbi:NPCBM/NEW2 domain-containing protein [Nonomuraea dietziae]|uniref:NPCBM/NEW2 domain-containing protein n=1 Tax=Nonomuraea dietziae TaxID=65515 RepID=UPI0033DD2215
MARQKAEESPADKDHRYPGKIVLFTGGLTFLGTLVSAVAVVVAAVINAPDTVRDVLGDNVVVTHTVTATATVTPSRTASPGEADSFPQGAEVALSTGKALTRVGCGETGFNRTEGDWNDRSDLIGGAVNPAPGIGCDVMDGKSASGTLDFLVPNGATEFTAEVGIDRESPNTSPQVEFSVLGLDGQVLAKQVATYTTSATVTARISGTPRITLKILVVKSDGTSMDNSFRVAWISPRFKLGT